jgi:chemotaxis protein CheD
MALEDIEVVKEHKVGIAEHKIGTPPSKIITLGLGSCVGVVLLDKRTGVGGMLHIMLPDSKQFSNAVNPSKYADTGVPLLLEDVLKFGANKKNLNAKLAGGAQMFKSQSGSSLLNIGERNIIKCREILKKMRINITGEDVGGSIGRTMILDCSSKKIYVRTAGKSPREI